MDAGEADPDFLASTQQFHQTLNKLGVKNVFYTFLGGHGIAGADYGWNYIHKHAFDSLKQQLDELKMYFTNSIASTNGHSPSSSLGTYELRRGLARSRN